MIAFDHDLIASHDYALINPLQVDQELWSDLEGQPVVPPAFETQPHLFPLLVDLNALRDERRMALVSRSDAWEQANPYPLISALLRSPASQERVWRHLVRTMHVSDEDTDRVWRIHDPRVFRHLPRLLDTEQMDALLGPIATWTWRESQGGWRSHARGSENKARLELWGDQWAALLRLEDVNLCLVTLKDVSPNLVVDDALVHRIDSLLVEADVTQQLTSPDDRRLYALQAIRFHPRIHHHPNMLIRLSLARTGKRSYVGACADLGDLTMHRLSADLGPHYKDRS